MTTERTGPGSAQAEPLDPCDRIPACGEAGNEDRPAEGVAPQASGVLVTDGAADGNGQPARLRARRALEEAEALLLHSLSAMRVVLDRFQDGTGTAAEVVAEAALLRRSCLSLFDERKRLAQLDPAGGGQGGDGAGVPVAALDLAAARAEIRRRLDRLRASAGGGGVS